VETAVIKRSAVDAGEGPGPIQEIISPKTRAASSGVTNKSGRVPTFFVCYGLIV
jgi:hypothetical protein